MRLTNTTPQTLMPGETIRRREKPQPQTPSRPSASTPPAPAVPAATNRHRPRRPPAPNTRRQLRRLHNLVDDIHKRLPHVLPCQRTDLGEEGAVRLGERAALFRRDLAALGCLVELGADLFVPFSQDLRGRQVSGVRWGGRHTRCSAMSSVVLVSASRNHRSMERNVARLEMSYMRRTPCEPR